MYRVCPLRARSIKESMFIVCFLVLLTSLVSAADISKSSGITKSFLIAKSTKHYREAKAFAEELSLKSGIRADFRGLLENRTSGLSEPEEHCRNEGFSYPCYIPRGRYDDGIYISVEYSDAYRGFSKGYYIVVVASGDIDKRLIERIRHYVADAYVKKSYAYMGCIH